MLFHDIVDGFKSIEIHSWLLSAQAQNSICLLRLEILRFSVNTPKCVLEHIDPIVEILPEVEGVLGYEALVAAALSVALIEPAAVLVCTAAVYLVAVVQLEVFRLFRVVEIVYMVTAHTWLAEVFARNGGNT